MKHVWLTTILLGVATSHTARAQAPVLVEEEGRLEITGYVQPELRYERNDGDDLVYFQVRRGRVKLEYELAPAGLVLQLDATERGVELKDAWGQIALPLPEGMEAIVMAGLFKVPFGLDLQYSSSRRVFPERSQLVRNFFPGERDLGLRVDASFAEELIEAQLAVQNGVPTGDPFFGAFEGSPDGDNYKDVTARIAANLEPVTLGLSGLVGHGTRFVEDDPTTPDVEEPFGFPRWAVGGEVRLQLELPPLGALDVYGELAYGSNLVRRRESFYPMNEGERIAAIGWYLAAVQELGELLAVGARFDQFRIEDSDASNVVTAVGMVVPAEAVRLVLAYDFHLGEGQSGANEGWLRMQIKF